MATRCAIEGKREKGGEGHMVRVRSHGAVWGSHVGPR